MEKNKLKNVCRAAAAVITALCTMLIIFLSAGKTQYHMDEVWSFGLANSYGRSLFYPTMYGVNGFEEGMYLLENEDYLNFFDHWHPGSYFGDYVTVQRGERFAYDNVWRNQKLDTSPPLYYAMIHTICSLFPDSFSKWYGLIPNIIFYALSLWLVWLIARQIFTDDIKALAALILCGISKAAISDAVFIRMYMLMTFLVLLLVWLFMKILATEKKRYIFAAAAVSIIGFLTQYYFYVTAFILTLCTCIVLLCRSEIRRALLTGLCELGAVAAAAAVFPAVINHVFHGPFSGRTVSGLSSMSPVTPLLTAPEWFFFPEESMLLFAIIMFILIIVTLLTAMLPSHRLQAILGGRKLRIKTIPGSLHGIVSDNRKASAVIITVSFLFSCSIISSAAPMDNVFSQRYLFPVMPLLALIIVGAADLITRFVVKLFTDSKKAMKPAAAVIFAFLSAAAAFNSIQGNPFLSVGDHGGYDIHSAVSGRNVLFITDDPILPHSFSYDFSSAERVYPINSGVTIWDEDPDGNTILKNDADEHIAAFSSSYDSSEPLIAVVCTDETEEDCRMLLENAEGFGIELISSTDHLLWENTHVFVYELTPAVS